MSLSLAYNLLGLRHSPRHSKLQCTLPIDLNNAGIERIKREGIENWFWTMKADGERAWMIICEGTVTMVSRNCEETKLAEGTQIPGIDMKNLTSILDGEVVQSSPLIFLAFDCLMLNGHNVHEFGFQTRFQWLQKLSWPQLELSQDVKEPEIKTTSEGVTCFLKPIWKLSQLSLSLRHQSAKNSRLRSLHVNNKEICKCDGLILMESRAQYFSRGRMANTEFASMLKLKECPTLDLAVFPTRFVSPQNKRVLVYCTGFKQKWLCLGELVSELPVPLDFQTIVECKWVADHKWEVLRVRLDKKFPNHEKVVMDTLAVIKQNLTIQEVIEQLCCKNQYVVPKTSGSKPTTTNNNHQVALTTEAV